MLWKLQKEQLNMPNYRKWEPIINVLGVVGIAKVHGNVSIQTEASLLNKPYLASNIL